MSGNSLETLLAWMKDDSRMLGWGMVVALERRKTNLLMTQEYIRRFDTGSYLPPIRGEVDTTSNYFVNLIHDFVMDVPLLSFENADLNDSKAMLTMAVVGGSQINFKIESVGWKPIAVDEIDPLQGPKLYLDLLLSQVPGDVDADGRVILDLRKSDNFRLTFGQTPHEQRLGGEFFKDLFNQLCDEQRIWPLGRIERGTSELMRPKSFKLRTQASGAAARDPQSPEYGNGAILALVRMDGSPEGSIPGADYRYLIPDDAGKDYSATVLFDWARLSPLLGWSQKLIDAIKTLFSTDDLEYVYSGNQLESVIVKSGGIIIGGQLEYRIPVTLEGKTLTAIVRRKHSFVPANGVFPFTLTLGDRGASMRWQSESVEETSLYYLDENEKEIGPFDMGKSVFYDLEAVFELAEVVGSDGAIEPVIKPVIFNFSITPPDVSPAQESNAAPGTGKGIEELILALVLLIWVVTLETLHKALGQVLIEQILRFQIGVRVALKPLIENIIKMNFGRAIERDQIRSPYDIGFFGRLDPTQTSFVISPMQLLMLQGSTRQFSTEPVVDGVRWAVENLIEGAGNPGTISASGSYQAPPAASIEGRFKRVRITATAPNSGYRSSALVTVLVNELSVHPLIQICGVGVKVELAAGVLGEDELLWSIKNPVANESGEVLPSTEADGDHSYHHGPVVARKTYVLDEIEVKNRRTNETRSVHVLATQRDSGVTVNILSTDFALGQVLLEAIVNGLPQDSAVWSLPLGGPGSIDATGLYRVDPAATERFVLIFAQVDGGGLGIFEGHLILPLPLAEFPSLPETLSQ
ncbi:hypothetical protein [Pseudomonas ogarae]|uniref:Uncharacterized protein n=1 Tax=Pseudomonas ogarae (strain DSM 112162 / CECT 30235 / F113) TaxID=1114970 RepID=A0ABN5GD34_PSEO1|nr:hypothetical protein [Pseudomonas ogarae]AEV64387.1 Hypothetical protein PSF113_4395 [Pseudomonas ogarae]AUO48214.1 hypothetical protein C1C98_23540 [Pseudomonas ogarae]